MAAKAIVYILYCWACRWPCHVAHSGFAANDHAHCRCVGDTAGRHWQDSAIFHRRIATGTEPGRPTLTAAAILAKPWLHLQGANVLYSFSSATGLDSLYKIPRLIQHSITADCNFTLFGLLPLHAGLLIQKSNSPFLPNLNEFFIDLAEQPGSLARPPEQFSMRLQRAMDDSLSRLKNLLRSNSLPSLDTLSSPEAINRLLECRRQLASLDFVDSTSRDSIARAAEAYIANWARLAKSRDSIECISDSLNALRARVVEERKLLESLSPAIGARSAANQLLNLAKADGLNTSAYTRLKALEALKSFSIGRSAPAYSDLTVSNIAVKGVNLAYSAGNVYFALVAGAVSNYWERPLAIPRPGQYVYSARIGYGAVDGNNIMLTWFNGRKQIVPGIASSSRHIEGCSLSAQFWLGHAIRLYAETASAIPQNFPITDSLKRTSLLHQYFQSNAFSIGCSGDVPLLHTALEAAAQYRGQGYQSFTVYNGSAAASRWRVKLLQTAWRGRLKFRTEVQKNDFENALALQRYNADAIFKNFAVSFRAEHLPSLSLGYIPASQLIAINDKIYESHFQQANAVLAWQYKLHMARAASYLMVNRCFNASADSGFLFYHATSVAFNQHFFFGSFSAHAGYSFSNNANYQLATLETGVEILVGHQQQLALGMRIFSLQHRQAHATAFGTINIVHRNWGGFSLKADGNYLPTVHGGIQKMDLYTVAYSKNRGACRFKQSAPS